MFLYRLERLGFFLFFHKRKEEETLNFFYQNHGLSPLILLHEKFLQSDWLKAVVFQLNLKYLHVKITKPLRVVA